MTMKNSHRMFLQSFMSRGILNAEDVFSLLKSSCEKYDAAALAEDKRRQLIDFVHTINGNLKLFGMEIKKGVDEYDGVGYYGLVNITESSSTLLGSNYTDNELQFFKTLVELIVLSDTGSVGSITAVNITDTLPKKMSKNDAEDLLDKFQTDKWIGRSEDGMIHLAARAVMEMEQYIFDMFGDRAIRCNMCKKLCLQGETCCGCDTKLHKHCSNKFFKDQTNKKCPVCRSSWEGDGTDRVLTPQPSTSSSTPVAPQTRKRKATT